MRGATTGIDASVSRVSSLADCKCYDVWAERWSRPLLAGQQGSATPSSHGSGNRRPTFRRPTVFSKSKSENKQTAKKSLEKSPPAPTLVQLRSAEPIGYCYRGHSADVGTASWTGRRQSTLSFELTKIDDNRWLDCTGPQPVEPRPPRPYITLPVHRAFTSYVTLRSKRYTMVYFISSSDTAPSRDLRPSSLSIVCRAPRPRSGRGSGSCGC